MNLIKRLEKCPACGKATSAFIHSGPAVWTVDVQSCFRECTRTHASNYGIGFDVTTSMNSVGYPHLHVTCRRCGFEWLEAVASPEGVKEAW